MLPSSMLPSGLCNFQKSTKTVPSGHVRRSPSLWQFSSLNVPARCMNSRCLSSTSAATGPSWQGCHRAGPDTGSASPARLSTHGRLQLRAAALTRRDSNSARTQPVVGSRPNQKRTLDKRPPEQEFCQQAPTGHAIRSQNVHAMCAGIPTNTGIAMGTLTLGGDTRGSWRWVGSTFGLT